jgi:prevent-host-death family protein
MPRRHISGETVMRTIGAYEAKTHFGELLRDVENGETITVTRHGVAVARIVPVQDDANDARSVIDEFLRFTRENDIRLGGGITIRELIEEGRR